MRILQICHKPPFPAVDGGAIAMNNVTQGLINKGHEVQVIAISTPKHPVVENDLDENYKNSTQFESVFIDTSIKVKDAFLNLFSNTSYNVDRFISDDFSNKLLEILKEKQFDVIIIESLFVTPYISVIKEFSKAKIILRAHNVEHKIWERISANTKNPIKKKYIDFLAKRMKSYEIETFENLDGICAMTNVDVKSFEKLGFKKKITSVPTGYILNGSSQKKEEVEANSIFHIASMDWLPNVEGVNWFLNNVWEIVKSQSPQAKLYLAGREMPDEFYNLNLKGVETVGPVKSAKEFFLSKNIMIVPILSGSGMRIKIIEGMALGKVIISTSVGAEGINCKSGKNIIIANSPDEFAQAIIKCLNDTAYCSSISKAARELIEEEYSNEGISEKMVEFFQSF